MASLTPASVTIPSFTGLKAASPARTTPTGSGAWAPMAFSVKASLKEVAAAAAAAAVASSAVLASNAMAMEVLLGSSDGGLVFVPNEFSVTAGETITFKNNAGFPHNVVFDEDEVPSRVNVSSISMSEEDLLNGPGETYTVTLKEKGTYSFYCGPHQGAGMVGKVTVN